MQDAQHIDPEAAAAAEAERRKSLPPAALRALEEAEARKAAADADGMPTELGGRIKGLEPVRYGDWEKKGLAIDF
ncbi:DUF1674 domain-containing protein [Aliiruegeria haliotis]|uniref:DUF1674 domain-containing protein n=1 Tax=Aliiruegeria haliotis TaxID=1280846 RepID=UPI003CCBE7E2